MLTLTVSLGYANEPENFIKPKPQVVMVQNLDSINKVTDVKMLQENVKGLNDSITKLNKEHKNYVEFKQKILGGLAVSDYEAGFIFVLIGLFIRWFYTTRKGIKKIDNNTPMKFDLVYWIKDNIIPKSLSILVTFLIVFVTLRFPMEIVGIQFSMFYCLLVGLGLDYIIDKIKKLKPIA